MKHTFDLSSTFQLDKFHLTLGGFYPLEKIKYKFLYIFARVFIHIIAWSILLGMLTFSLIHVTNLAQFADTMTCNMTQIPFLCKLVNFHIQMKTVLKLEECLRRPSLTWITDEEEAAIKDTMKGARRLTTIYRSLIVTIVGLFAIFPLIDKNSGEEKNLPLPMWFPFDVQNHHHTVWCYEVFGICVSSWTNTNLDSFSVILITLTVCQFRMLTKRLRNVVKETESMVEDEVVQKELKECIILYNDITRLMELVETTFSNGIFLQFICSVFVICMIGFQMMVVNLKSIQFFHLLAFFFGQICQLLMYCWYGQTLMESSDSISEACYFSDWFKCSAQTQKYFIIIMERSKRPVIMRAGKFFFLQLDTLMAILKSSYSYFAVLQQINSDK